MLDKKTSAVVTAIQLFSQDRAREQEPDARDRALEANGRGQRSQPRQLFS